MHVWVRYIGLFLAMALSTYTLANKANEEDTQLLEDAQSVEQPMDSETDDAPLMHSTEESELLFSPHQLYVTLAQYQSQVVVQLIVSAEDVLPNLVTTAKAGTPLTRGQTQQVQSMITKLKDLATIIELPESAQCKVLHTEITSDLTNTDTPIHNEQDESQQGSSDFQGMYQLDCDQVEKLEWISIKAFKQFPKLKTALIEWMASEQSGHAILNPKSITVHFNKQNT